MTNTKSLSAMEQKKTLCVTNISISKGLIFTGCRVNLFLHNVGRLVRRQLEGCSKCDRICHCLWPIRGPGGGNASGAGGSGVG